MRAQNSKKDKSPLVVYFDNIYFFALYVNWIHKYDLLGFWIQLMKWNQWSAMSIPTSKIRKIPKIEYFIAMWIL